MQAAGTRGAHFLLAGARRDAHRAGVGGELPVAELLPGGLLNNLVILRLHVGDVDSPTFRGGGLQHHAGGGADLAHWFDEMAGRT